MILFIKYMYKIVHNISAILNLQNTNTYLHIMYNIWFIVAVFATYWKLEWIIWKDVRITITYWI